MTANHADGQNNSMVRWADFDAEAPALATFGRERLSAPPAYLATVSAGEAPRVHPVTPIIGGGRLFVFMEPSSPKGRDLKERRWYALHNGVADTHGSGGEFWVTGQASVVSDRTIRQIATQSSSYEPAEHYVLFELGLAQARCNGYGDVVLPEPTRWTAASE